MFDLSNPSIAADNRSIDFALLNGGAIRLDDYLGPGLITSYDVVKPLPFGGDFVTVLIPIQTLSELLKRSWIDTPIGSGGIVHLYPQLNVSEGMKENLSSDQIKDAIIEVLEATGKDSPETVKLILPKYLVTFGDDFSEEDKSRITIIDEKLPIKAMQILLQKAFETVYPL